MSITTFLTSNRLVWILYFVFLLFPKKFYNYVFDGIFIDRSLYVILVNLIFSLLFDLISQQQALTKYQSGLKTSMKRCLFIYLSFLFISTVLNNRILYEWPYFIFFLSFLPLIDHLYSDAEKSLTPFIIAISVFLISEVYLSLSAINEFEIDFLVGSFNNPDQFSIIFSSGMLMIIYFIQQTFAKDTRIKYLLIVSMLVIIMAVLVYNSSRTTLLFFIIAAVFLFKARIKKTLLVLICIISFCFLLILNPDSTRGRLSILKISLGAIADGPFYGNGKGSFPVLYNLYQADYLKKNSDAEAIRHAGSVEVPYNEFINMLFEMGIVMSVILFWMMYKVYASLIQLRKHEVSLLLLFIAVHFSFSYPLQVLYFPEIILMSATLIISRSTKQEANHV